MEGARYPRCENNNVEGMGGSPPGFRVRIYVRGELSPADRIGEISCARCRFLTGRKLNPRERQFRRGSAASICARRRRLLDKRSNSLCKEIYYGGGMYSPSPSSEGSVYIRYIYIYIYIPFSAAFRIHFTCQPRARLARHPVYPSGYIRMARGERKPTDDT